MPPIELEPDYKRERGNQSGTETFYVVEVRSAGTHPLVACGQAVTSEWLPVIGRPSEIGVPHRINWCSTFRDHEFTMAGAQAIRWWFHAEAEQSRGGVLIETRIVKCETKYTSVTTAVNVVDVVDGLLTV